MRLFKITLVLFLVFTAVKAQQTYVPDDNFELALIDMGYDTLPLNDSIPTKNIDTVDLLDVSNKNISDVTGIEDFTALTHLDISDNSITDLNLSKNTKMKFLNCSYNALSLLNLTNNIDLTSLDCSRNSLKELDISKNIKLTLLNCRRNNLKRIDVSKCIELRTLSCESNSLVSLDVSDNPYLTYLGTINNRNLECIKVNSYSHTDIKSKWDVDSSQFFSADCD